MRHLRNGMNIIDLLKKDHRAVEALFEAFGTAESDEKELLARRIFQELDVHAEIEEQIFYPDLEPSHLLVKKLQHAYAEHAEVKELIAELRRLSPDDESFEEMMEALMAGVREHVAEEETEIMPSAEQALGREMLDHIGKEAEQLRETLVSRLVDDEVTSPPLH